MADNIRRLPGAVPEQASARSRKGFSWWDRKSLARREVGRDMVSLSNLIGRPVRGYGGARVGRVADVVADWKGGAKHPLVSGVLVKVGKGTAMVPIDELTLTQTAVRISSPSVGIEVPPERDGSAHLARDVLDHQLVDVAGVQVVRAADVYLLNLGRGWEVAGVDVGAWALLRRLLPKRRRCPPADRALDWADAQAFVPRFPEEASAGVEGPAGAADASDGGVRLAYPAAQLHRLRAKDVARLLGSLDRGPQAQLAAMADPSTAAKALADLDPPKLDALLSQLDAADRSRLTALMHESKQ
jgi:sporulation protein YlmC with PRC-barrel domain